jgi:hypothetical protein
VVPFILLQILAILIIWLAPPIATWLPRLAGAFDRQARIALDHQPAALPVSTVTAGPPASSIATRAPSGETTA